MHDDTYGLTLHPIKEDCGPCTNWYSHYDNSLWREDPSLMAAIQDRKEALEKGVEAVREEKDRVIAALRRQLEEAERKLKEVRQGNVSSIFVNRELSANTMLASQPDLPHPTKHARRTQSHTPEIIVISSTETSRASSPTPAVPPTSSLDPPGPPHISQEVVVIDD